MSFEGKIEQLTNSSRVVIEDCAVENGAILAANTDLPYYPESAVNYRYVWPRDAAFVIYAAEILGLPDIKANFAQWLLNRAEGFSDSGVIIKRYSTNGRHDLGYGQEYQPDQAGAMLWAFQQTSREPDAAIDKTVTLLASGLSAQWEDTHFTHPIDAGLAIQDLWEDQSIQSSTENVFTYSLATAVYGLEQANIRLGDKVGVVGEAWTLAIDSMNKLLNEPCEQAHYPWKLPFSLQDRQTDASLSGLVWPFKIASTSNGIKDRATLELIETTLHQPTIGIKRYAGDRYDGLNYDSSTSEGAGAWPLLSFWYAIALKKSGQPELADDIYRETLESLPNDYIPEQLTLDARSAKPPQPLAWAHAMFIIASRELGYLD